MKNQKFATAYSLAEDILALIEKFDMHELYDTIINGIDSIDSKPTGNETEAKFYMSAYVNKPNPNYKGYGPARVIMQGRYNYKITIERTYEPFDDEE